MVIAGVNFFLLYRVLVLRRARAAVRDQELRLYLALLALATAAITAELLWIGESSAVRHGAFQAVSVMTTAGFTTVDWTTWGPLAMLTLLMLMFIGASRIALGRHQGRATSDAVPARAP